MNSPTLESCPQPARVQGDHCAHEFIPLRGPCGKDLAENAEIQLSVLCFKCKALKELIEERWKTWRYDDDIDHYSTNTIAHYHSLGLLRDSFQRGCHLCSLMWESLVNTRDVVMSRMDWDEKKLGSLPLTVQWRIRSSIFFSSIEVRVPSLNKARIIDICYRIPELSAPTTSVSAVSTKAAICRSFYKESLRICNETHTKCRVKRVGQQPTRLLRLAPDPSGTPNAPPCIQLVLSSDEGFGNTRDRPDFAALSYCWGRQKEEGLHLTKSNYESLKENIPYNELPATIQDSIIVTIDLGLHYLWVDALCIIQDSHDDDWPREANKMFDIYQGCSIALMASDASDSSEGLFAARDPLRQTACVLGKVLAAIEQEWLRPNAQEDCILETRGWALQEHILPSRSIKFGHYLTWECREFEIDEFGGRKAISEGFERKCDFFSKILEPEPTNPTRIETERILDLWNRILRKYGRTKLTVKGDRLAAIRGLSSAFEQRTRWTLVYGLWKPFIIQQLLWRRNEDAAESTGLRPSWSWASRDGGTIMGLREREAQEAAEYVGMISSVSRGLKLDSLPVLELSGFLCRTRECNLPAFINPDRHYLHAEGWSDTLVLQVAYDEKGRQWTDDEMILPLTFPAHLDRYGIRLLRGLVVVFSKSFQAFERVGYFEGCTRKFAEFGHGIGGHSSTDEEVESNVEDVKDIRRSLMEPGTEPFVRQKILLI